MKTNQDQSKQGSSNRLHTSFFIQTGKQTRWFALAAFAVIVTAFCLAAFVQPAAAQDVFGRISGTVTDTQGAVIPDASVTITNEQTKLSRTVKTDANGFYVAEELPVGLYTVGTAEHGFKAFKKTGNDLTAGTRLTVDMKLEVGATTDIVEVNAAGEAVNTVSGELARTVDSSQVQTLALNERNYVQLVSLVPGAALTAFDQTALTTGMSVTASSLNGRRADGNNFTVDGGFNMDAGSNTTQLNNVGIDFIEEVSIKTSNFSAEYGRNDGASVNVVTRSGGDKFHGGLFEYLRNNQFDAIPSINKVNIPAGATTKSLESILRYNDFGWNLGGPIKHKKLFFFVGQEWKRIRQLAATQNLTLPTTAELAGNFSAILPPAPGQPGVTLKLPTAPGSVPAGCTITANVLSPQCITPDGAAIAAVFTKLSSVASTFSNTDSASNAIFQPNNPQNWREDIARVDYQLNSAHTIFGRYIHDDLNLIDAFGTFVPGNSLPTTPTNRIRPGYSIQASDVWTISPHLINEAKFNVSWNKQRIPPSGTLWQRATYGFQFTPPLGFVGTFPNGIPHITFNGVAASPTSGPAGIPGPFFSLLAPTVDISPTDNLTWTLGSHTLKFGVMFARNRKDQNSRTDSYDGRIVFAATAPKAGITNSTGDPVADALLGNYQTFSQPSADPVGHFRFDNTEGYVNDSWKVARRLSLEIGLRYQYIGATYVQGNNIGNFDPALYVPGVTLNPAANNNSVTATSPGVFMTATGPILLNGLVVPGAVPPDQLVRVPGGNSPIVLATTTGGPRGLYAPKNLFAPRFGFSFSPFNDDKTTIRGGFGIFYDKPEGNVIFGQTGVVPFLSSVQFNNGSLSTFNGSNVLGQPPTIFGMSAVDPNFKNAYSMQYSFGIQHELPYGVLGEVSYVGNQGRHEVRQPNINVPSLTVTDANPTMSTNQLRPFLGYTDITQFRSDSNSNYNGLQFFATKRKGNLLASVSYTWSKALGDTSGINDNPEPECAFTCTLANGQTVNWRRFDYGPLTFDRRDILVFTYNYAFPFFRAQQGPLGVALGGWELGGITRFQTGQPLTVTAGNLPVGTLQFTRRADFNPAAPLYSGFTCPSVTKCWFDPGVVKDPITKATINNIPAFLTTGAADPTIATQIGNAPVGNVIGPGYFNWDVSARKRFNLPHEGMNLMLQLDLFNIFNHTNWGNPGTNAASGLGIITTSAPPRQLQFALKFNF
ncbi:MAG TPA: carboxypeptidase regulatory-like domain-containing protein [Terriglobales bacterium]|nr:carboxypeptidase regulatory-like domain-containing protein [Terriglobales bacterium]